MLTLNNHLKMDSATIKSTNLTDKFDKEDLDRIGAWVVENYTRDKQSRVDWERRTESALNLAMQVQKDKTFPWQNCSNIAFPLITIAALQFHARAYPAIVNGKNIVQVRVLGEDPDGTGKARASRVSRHMSWQCLEQDEGWEEDTDRSLLYVAIVGVGWKKSYYDPSLRHNRSEFVSATDLVVNYWARSIESARVKTHIIPMYRNEVRENMLRGIYEDCRDDAWFTGAPAPQFTSPTSTGQDNRAGLNPPDGDGDTPYRMLEQHCWLDLDKDGYDEPYIITVEESSATCVRIVCRFERPEDIEYNDDKEIVRIAATEYFTKIPFIPSPDGGIMDIGFGRLLGPLNESVNSSINQLFDAGTLANTAGGFLGRGAKIRGGVYQFQPFGWNRVDATGDDLRKSVFPLPVREPSGVMFNLLSLLIEYTNRVAGSTDMMVGENPGQNTPAETSRVMLEQGQKIYSAIFKRMWRSMKQEFKKLYTLNGLYLPPRSMFGQSEEIRREDYAGGPLAVVPAADPLIASDSARFARATLVAERAAAVGGYDTDETEKMLLKEMGVDQIETIFPGTKGQEPPVDVKIQLQQMKSQIEMAKLEQQKMEFIVTMQESSRLTNAKILQLEAQAKKLEAQADTEPGKQNVAAFRAGIEAIREQANQQNAMLDRMMENLKNERERATNGKPVGVGGMEEAPNDPALLQTLSA